MSYMRKLKLSPIQRQVLTKIKERKVKNIEIPTGIVHPFTGKKLKASAVNLSNVEAAQFRNLERKGLISAYGKIEYFTNFRLTPKGRFQFRGRQ